MFTRDEIPNIIPALIERLYELPDGACASTVSLLRDCGFKDEDFMPVVMEIHCMLFEAADAEHIRLILKSREERGPGPVCEAEFRVSHGGAPDEDPEAPVVPPEEIIAAQEAGRRLWEQISEEEEDPLLLGKFPPEWDGDVMPWDDEDDLDIIEAYIETEDWEAVTGWAEDHEDSHDPMVKGKVAECYRLASGSGLIRATVDLANLYYNGKIVKQDYKESFRLNKIAADAGDRRGITNCGYCCYYGRHEPVDYAGACMYFSLGAMLYNDANCLYKLGDLFRYGYGVEQNEVYGYMLYERAYERCQESMDDFINAADCALRLGECMLRGIGTEVDVDGAHVKLNYALMNFYRVRRDDPHVAGPIKKTKALLAEAEAILDKEISGMDVDL